MSKFTLKIIVGCCVFLMFMSVTYKSWPAMFVPVEQELPVTEVDALEFFHVPNNDAMLITWEHRVNTKLHLEKSLSEDSPMMLEADVRLKEGVPVMAHLEREIISADMNLKDWLDNVLRSATKGIKLDFKSTEVLEPSLQILEDFKNKLRVPTWLNADVLAGPNSKDKPVDADQFFKLTQTHYPTATLSPGWTTGYNEGGKNEGYSQSMVEEMYSYCMNITQPISFPVRASLVVQSISPLRWLVERSPQYSLTVWHSSGELLPVSDLLKIHGSFDKSKVYYDLTYDVLKEFKNGLKKSSQLQDIS